MSLRDRVQRFVAAVRGNPVLASDPAELRALEKAAETGLEEGYTTLTAPNATRTWEVKATLANNVAESNIARFVFPWRTNVVGLYPSISVIRPAGGAPLVVPTLDDIEVMIDINNQARLTGNGNTSQVGAGGNNFVTLASIGVFVPRLMALAIVGDSKPLLDFTFRWKQPPPAVAPFFYESVIVSVSAFCEPRDRELSQNVNSGLVGT